jgi:hypothetical protein
MAQGTIRVAAKPPQGGTTVGQQQKSMAVEMGRRGPFINTDWAALLPQPPGQGQPAGASSNDSCMDHR